MRDSAACCVLIAACTLVARPAQGQRDIYAPTVLQIAPTPRAATFANTTAARDIEAMPILSRVERAKEEIGDDELARFGELETDVESAFSRLVAVADSEATRAEAG